MFESIMWFAIGFGLTYGAMELAWRIAKRRMKDKRRVSEIATTIKIPTIQQR